MMTETLKNQKVLIDAGFSESDIASWQAEQRRALSDAGDRIAEAEKALAHALFERRASLFQLLAVVGAHREP